MLNRGTKLKDVRGICERVEICGGFYADIIGPKACDAEELNKRMEMLYNAGSEIKQKEIVTALDPWMNNASVMLRFHAGDIKILLPGDINSSGYGHLAKRADLLKADIFKMGHHGQIDGATAPLIEKINPRIIVTCASSDRRYESANPKIFEMVEKSVRTYKPIFLFSDIVNLPPYSQGMKDHYAVVLDIDESNGGILWVI